ncbi:hypothetical protein OHA59_36680 [Streptomyces sp. NBC_01589]|uniref:hypothetical protein n=1 Tax=Streptomyces sp. NBC_01589 TaxID=2975886 RepID=UPI00386AB6FD
MDDSLSFESFYKGAKKAAYKAMDDHARGEYDEFALHAGVAIERLAKAVLYKLNPLYIASGKVNFGTNKQVRVHTITAMESLSRLSSLNILKVDADLKLLIELRNGTVHASAGDEAKIYIPTLAKAVGAMLKHLDVSMHAFWDRWTSAVNMAVNKQKSQIERDVELRIKQARHLFNDRFKGLPQEAKNRALEPIKAPHGFVLFPPMVTISFIDGAKISLVRGVVCPACSGQAGMNFQAVPSPDTGTLATIPDSFSCDWCQLRLYGAEQIEVSGLNVQQALKVASAAMIQFDPPSNQAASGVDRK